MVNDPAGFEDICYLPQVYITCPHEINYLGFHHFELILKVQLMTHIPRGIHVLLYKCVHLFKIQNDPGKHKSIISYKMI